jgi:hypothetical protein
VTPPASIAPYTATAAALDLLIELRDRQDKES